MNLIVLLRILLSYDFGFRVIGWIPVLYVLFTLMLLVKLS
jgi:hypothetical protein